MWKSLKRWPVLVASLVAVGALAVGLVCLPYGSRVTRENCERIREGMTEAEVRAILGKPWDNSLLDPEEPRPPTDWRYRYYSPAGTIYSRLWVGSDFVVFVVFDRNNQVAFTELLSNPPSRSTLPARVWRRLRARLG
jgi:SmpA / OmlA family